MRPAPAVGHHWLVLRTECASLQRFSLCRCTPSAGNSPGGLWRARASEGDCVGHAIVAHVFFRSSRTFCTLLCGASCDHLYGGASYRVLWRQVQVARECVVVCC